MKKIRIVTDSTADISKEVREALDIEMVPLKVHFGTDTYQDYVTIQPKQFYELLANNAALPTTSQPSPVEFVEIYKKLTLDPDVQIISLHISSALSGTFQSATLAKQLLEGKADITIYDSKSASYGLGLLVIAAAEAAKQGKSKDEILTMIRKQRGDSTLYFLVDTLEYLQKGGRIGKAAAFMGSLLNIKPILSVDTEGEVVSVDKVRGQKKAMMRIVELLRQKEVSRHEVQFMIAHSTTTIIAEEFGLLLQDNFQVKSLLYTQLGPVIGTHVGPGALSAFMYPV